MDFQFKTEVGWEEGRTQDGETLEECAARIVQRFNETLRPGEKPRTVLGVRDTPVVNRILRLLNSELQEMVDEQGADDDDEDKDVDEIEKDSAEEFGRIQGMELAIELVKNNFGEDDE